MTASSDIAPNKTPSIRIGLPIALLMLLFAVLLGALLTFAVRGQDQVARKASETIVRGAFGAERSALESLVRDYSWWNASVENLIFELNPEWIPENLGWIVENFDVSRVFVLGPGQKPVYASLEAEPIGKQDGAWQDPLLSDLIARAESLREERDASLSAYLRFDDGIHLAAASKLLQEADTSGHPPYPDKGILIVTKKIDQALLDRIQVDFQLPGLSLQPDSQAVTDRATLALDGPEGDNVTLVTWPPPRPGTRLLEEIIVPLVLAFALVGGLMTVILRRARRGGAALQQAFDARVAAQNELEYAAGHDTLTKLPNRALFLEHLSSAIAHAERYGFSFALHYLDLDGFKPVNDTYGHPAGDELLRQLAVRLGGIVRAADTVARFGGDEFAVLQPSTGGRDDAGRLAQRMIDAVAEPFLIAGEEVHVALSIGIAFETGGDDPEEIIREADRALYHAKHQGGNRYAVYEASLDADGIQ